MPTLKTLAICAIAFGLLWGVSSRPAEISREQMPQHVQGGGGW